MLAYDRSSVLIFTCIVFITLCFILSVEISQAANKQTTEDEGYATAQVNAPETELLHVLRKLYRADTDAHIQANIIMIEDAILKYGNSDPWAAKAYYMLGMYKYCLGKQEEALVDFKTSASLPEPYLGLHYFSEKMKMNTFSDLGQTQEALASLKKLDSIPCPSEIREKDKPNLIMLKAEMEAKIKDKGIKSATETYKQYIEESKVNGGDLWDHFTPYAYRALGHNLANTGKTQEAIQIYDEFLRRLPTDPACALVEFERMRLIRDKMQLSASDLLNITKKYPTDNGPGQHVLYELAQAYLREGNMEMAASLLNKIFNFNPSKTDNEYSASLAAKAGLSYALLLQKLGRDDKVKAVLLDIKKRFPKSPDAKYASELLNQIKSEQLRTLLLKVITVAIPVLVIGIIVFISRKKYLTSYQRS